MKDSLTLGVLQFAPVTGTIEKNLARIEQVIASASGQQGKADLFLLPEMCLTGFDYPRLAELAEIIPGLLGKVAAILKPYARTIGLTIPGKVRGGVTNRFVLIDDRGTILHHYDKIHCIGHGGFRETEYITPGKNPSVFMLKGWQIGVGICYDLRFPELFRMMRKIPPKQAGTKEAPEMNSSIPLPDAKAYRMGPHLLLLPAQWPSARQDAFLTLSRARAIENQSYFAMANTVGKTGCLLFKGGSSVFGPRGEVLQALGKSSGAFTVQLSRNAVEAYRTSFPVLSDTVLI